MPGPTLILLPFDGLPYISLWNDLAILPRYGRKQVHHIQASERIPLLHPDRDIRALDIEP